MSEMRRIVVGVSGSPASLQALRFAAWLAGAHECELAALLTWTPPGGELAERGHPSPQLLQIWKDSARHRLLTAIDLALGGPPEHLSFSSQIRRAEAGPALVSMASQPGDVLVIGAGRRGPVARLVACGVCRYCIAHAACPVIAIPPSPLQQASRGLRGWMSRRRGLALDELGFPQGAEPPGGTG
jgi:nucleotide-binding universal stress UspA family protein